jgi:hypothetical protein
VRKAENTRKVLSRPTTAGRTCKKPPVSAPEQMAFQGSSCARAGA